MWCLRTFVPLVWLVAACGSDSSTAPIGPTLPPRDVMPGSLVVQVSTQGDSLDPDGYVVAVLKDSTAVGKRRLVGDREASFDLRPGLYIVTLGDVAPQCELEESPELFGGFVVSVQSGRTIALDLHVACAATPGRLRISVAVHIDVFFWFDTPTLDTLPVLIDYRPRRQIPPDGGSIDFYPVPAGVHRVTLAAPPWCRVEAESGGDTVHDSVASVLVPPWGLGEVKFDVFC